MSLETSKIAAVITPEVNGKVWELFDKINKRDMVQSKTGKANPRHFANIATHKMWGSGGIEINYSQYIGHSAFAERGLFAAKFDTEKGPVIRTYEFDRFNGTTFQVDWFVEEDMLFMHPKLTNYNENTMPLYWWTCVANSIGDHRQSQERIISPVDHVGQTETDPIRYSTWPYFSPGLNSSFYGKDGSWSLDHSWPSNFIWGDYFFDVRPGNDKWVQISYLDPADQGYSVWHGHDIGNGTKFFSWGANANSVFMQRFLGDFQPNQNYVELQTGLMKTQSQQSKLPGLKDGGNLEWTEYFKAWMPTNDEADALGAKDYKEAVNATQEWAISERGIPHSKRQEIDTWLKSLSTREIKKEEVLYAASPWGALHNKLRAHFGLPPMAGHTNFFYNEEDTYKMEEVRPWDELLTKGTFSAESLASIPISFQASHEWKLVLEESIQKYGANWLNLFHLAVIEMEEGAVDRPRLLLKQSLALKATPHAYRCLALLQETEQDAASILYKAFNAALALPRDMKNRDTLVYYLASETSSFLQATGLAEKPGMREHLRYFIEDVVFARAGEIPEAAFTTDQIRSSQLALHLWHGRPEQVIQMLSDDSINCYPTYGKQRSELNDYWNNANWAIAAKTKGSPLTIAEQRDVLMNNFPPMRVGCSYQSWYSVNPKCWF